MTSGWTYEFTTSANRELRRLAEVDQRRVVEAVRRMVDDPFSGDVRKLSGSRNEWRLRVGAWRVRFEMIPDSKTVVVHSVRRRPDAYRD